MTRPQLLTLLLALFGVSCGGAIKAVDPGLPVVGTTPTPAPLANETAGGANAAAAPAKPFECTVVLGLAVTGEWFGAGFEEAVGDAHWQAVVRPHTFVEQWANPQDPVWSQVPVSPCERRAESPDRVVFFAADWKYKDESEWVVGLTAAVSVIRSKYPEARQIELLPMLRGPRNESCGDPKSAVEPFIDEAMDEVSRQFVGLVRRGPRFEVPSCGSFEKGGPHFTAAGRIEVAQMMAAHYSSEH